MPWKGPINTNFIDEAGFNLRCRNIIGQCVIVDVPGQHSGNVILYAAISNWEVLHHHANHEAYKTKHVLTILGGLQDVMAAQDQLDQ